MQHVVPMLHVTDVRTAIDWYTAIGFALVRTNEEDGVADWASLSMSGSEIMLSLAGRPGTGERRDVDLYIHTNELDAVHRTLRHRVDIIEDLHDTFYGMREFIIRDPDGFWITFAQPLTP